MKWIQSKLVSASPTNLPLLPFPGKVPRIEQSMALKMVTAAFAWQAAVYQEGRSLPAGCRANRSLLAGSLLLSLVMCSRRSASESLIWIVRVQSENQINGEFNMVTVCLMCCVLNRCLRMHSMSVCMWMSLLMQPLEGKSCFLCVLFPKSWYATSSWHEQ